MKQKLSIGEILNLLPHRYPFLLVDKILEQEENKIVPGSPLFRYY